MENGKSISLLLYDSLNRIGVSEKIRRRHQEAGIQQEMLMTLDRLGVSSQYVFGSSCEGTTTYGLNPDFDILWCNEFCPVIENLTEAPKNGNAALLTLDNDTAPGYVKLQVVKDGVTISKNNHDKYLPMEDKNMTLHRSGKYLWKGMIEECPFLTASNGPALVCKHPLATPFDCVYSLRCRKWPTFANEWLSRKRNHSWPNKLAINHLKLLGFFVVYVGHPNSHEKDFEWRVSFSLQERQFIFDLNDVQYKCYVMLKLINHDLIKANIGESLTSYHCKTCLFYAIEQNSESIWVPENLFQCVMICLRILLIWARKGFCPNYFIPNENMFDRNMTDKIRLKVIDVLNNLVTEGASFLKRMQTDKIGEYFINKPLRIKATKNYSDFLTSSMNYFLQTALIENVVLARLTLLHNMVNIDVSKDKTVVETCSVGDTLRAINRHRKLLAWLDSIENITEHTISDSREAIDLLLPYFHTSLACHLFAFAMKCKNVSFRNENLRLSLKEFNKGMVSDLTSGRLKYLTYLYIRGQYSLCEQELISLEQKFEPHVIWPLRGRGQPTNINPYLQTKLETQEYCKRYILKHFAGVSVIFLPTEIEIIPDALQFEMFRSAGSLLRSRNGITDFWYDWVVVDSKVYMYFLWYLIGRKMNYSKEVRQSFIKKLAPTTCDSFTHMETAFNLMAWAFVQENCISQAIICMWDSWNIVERYKLLHENDIQRLHQSHHNAVKWHMLLLLWHIWFSETSTKGLTVSFCFKCFEQKFASLKKCSSCKIAKYCSKRCQKIDWNEHNNVCKLFV